jgi:hydroxymethylglutaryl-CoA reductase (NADPH)
MSTAYRRAMQYVEQLLQETDEDELVRRLEPRHDPLPPPVPGGSLVTSKAIAQRWGLLNVSAEARAALDDGSSAPETYQRNIENYIGTVKLPVGLAGPLRINGLFANGDFYVPLSTTEAALVASYHRGAQLISRAGGCSAMLLIEGVSRAPGFHFRTIAEAGLFISWAVTHHDAFRDVAESTTRHGKLVDMRAVIEGNNAYLVFDFTTGDAAGQNMVTIATQAICAYILTHSPVAPQYHFVEANLSGDKKASAQSFLSVRGKKVSAEVVIPGELVERLLHTTSARMAEYWRMSAMGGMMSGTIGVEGHYANGLAALYIACGQDAACTAESAVGITRFECHDDGSLYSTVMLPNLIVGTVGGGTGLPTQRACLEMLGLAGPDHARAFAEVCAAVALAGELSIAGALSAGDFTRAHQRLARGKGRDAE